MGMKVRILFRASSFVLIIYVVSTDDDVFVKLAEDGVSAFADATTPGNYLVEFLPWSTSVFGL